MNQAVLEVSELSPAESQALRLWEAQQEFGAFDLMDEGVR